MKMLFIALASSLFANATMPQTRTIGGEWEAYFDWFHRQSQVEQLYSNGATLYAFGDKVAVHSGASRNSKIIATLSNGHSLKNIGYATDAELPTEEINGYGDFWYRVKGQNAAGKAFQGYVWGGHIAKGWRKADLTGDGKAEFVLLGVSSKPRKKLTDIHGELRILQKGRVLHRSDVPGLCLFEDCGSSALLRILNVPAANNALVIEASTMTIGCWAGIEKTYFYWNGSGLELICHAELISGKVLSSHPFSVKDKNGAEVMNCRYVREGDDYNPLWDCRGTKAKPAAAQAVVVRAK